MRNSSILIYENWIQSMRCLWIQPFFVFFSGTYGSVSLVNDTEVIPASSAGNCSSQTDFGGNEDEDFFRPSLAPTDFSEIPAKEIIIVILMLSLWVYSIILTRRAWYQFLKEWWNTFYVPREFYKSTVQAKICLKCLTTKIQ